MRTLWMDVKYGLRLLRGSPAFTVVAVATLALGIAANTTVFSWIDGVVLRPLPGVSDGGRLAVIESLTTGWNGGAVLASHNDYRAARDNLKLVSGVAAFTPAAFSVGDGERAQRVWGEFVSGNYFAVLGVKPIVGRVFSPEEYGDKPGGYPVAVISERLWRGQFRADRSLVGKTVRVNRQELTVVGVVPAEFQGAETGLFYDLWTPLMMMPQLTGADQKMFRDGSRNYLLIARLAPGVTMEQARAEAVALARRQAELRPKESEGLTATVVPVGQAHMAAQNVLRKPLAILMAVCAVVLLIVCANVANLLLARATARQKEFSIRLALGAGRGRIARQVAVETLLLAGMGAVAGVPLALWTGDALVWLLPATSIRVGISVQLNWAVLAFTAAVCVLTAALASVVPLLHSIRPSVNETLKEGGRSGTGGARAHRIRGLLVVSEVALALVALIGAGLFLRSFQAARGIPPGFDARDAVVAQYNLSTCGYSAEQGRRFAERVRAELRAVPGIHNASYASWLPLGFSQSSYTTIQVEGYVPSREEKLEVYHSAVAPGYFRMLRIPVLEGREFAEHDDADAAPVMMVNEAFVRRYFNGGTAVGRRVRFWRKWATVVGVVRDTKIHSLTERPMPYFHMAFAQRYEKSWSTALVVRGEKGEREALATIRRVVARLDPAVAVTDTMPLAEYMHQCLFQYKVVASMLSVMGAVALALAAAGLYSVMAYAVSQRTREIGIRTALGAQTGDVLGMVLRQGMGLVGLGVVAGALSALALMRLVAGLLISVTAADPLIYTVSAAFLALVALVATLVPARRATRVDPMIALRCE